MRISLLICLQNHKHSINLQKPLSTCSGLPPSLILGPRRRLKTQRLLAALSTVNVHHHELSCLLSNTAQCHVRKRVAFYLLVVVYINLKTRPFNFIIQLFTGDPGKQYSLYWRTLRKGIGCGCITEQRKYNCGFRSASSFLKVKFLDVLYVFISSHHLYSHRVCARRPFGLLGWYHSSRR